MSKEGAKKTLGIFTIVTALFKFMKAFPKLSFFLVVLLSGFIVFVYMTAPQEHPQLRTALENNNTELLQTVIDRGADVNEAYNFGLPILVADTDQELRILLEAGADVNARVLRGDTPLHRKVSDDHYYQISRLTGQIRQRPNPNTVGILLGAGADVNARNDEGETPLHYSVVTYTPFMKTKLEHRKEITRMLVQAGADIDTKNNKGETPLHSAARKGRIQLVSLLVQMGADVNVEDDNGETPVDIASLHTKPETRSEMLSLLNGGN